VALSHLFGFGHTQSDDIHAKKAAPVFVKNILALLEDHQVVIADRFVAFVTVLLYDEQFIDSLVRNNHLRQHREALRAAVANMDPPVRLLALHWDFNQPLATIHRICGDRILNRGENHQTLRANPLKSHEEIVWKFIDGRQELTENEVDACIEMEIGESMEQALDRAIDGCVRFLGLQKPDKEKVSAALTLARGYKPQKKKAQGKIDDSQPRYFGLLAEVEIRQILAPAFSNSNVPERGRNFWDTLSMNDRVTTKPHITIVHSKTQQDDRDLWDRCTNLRLLPQPPQFEFRLGSVVWNERVMAITVEDITVCEDGPNREGAEFITHIQDITNGLHITIGTRDKDVSPFEARSLVQSWKQGEAKDGAGSLTLPNTRTKGRLHGLRF
jgi:tRNA ligase